MILEQVIFAVDNGHDVHTQAKFLRELDTLRAMGKLKGTVESCTGSYKGVLERVYMMTAVDFEAHIRGSTWLSGQESILRVPGDVRQPCVLEYLEDGRRVALGIMKEQTYIVPLKTWFYQGWTYVESKGKYYAC